MPRTVWEIEVDSDTPREELELCALAAERTSDSNVQRVAAQARAELWRREQAAWAERLNAESLERVKAQRFQEAQSAKQLEAQERAIAQQLEVAREQSQTAARAARAASWSALATIAIAVLTAILAAVTVFDLVWK